MSAMSDQRYLIMAGVRRSVCAREAGLNSIRAVVLGLAGRFLQELFLSLDCLFSPKGSIERSDVQGRYLKIESAMLDDQLRTSIPSIEVRPIGEKTSKRWTRLFDVIPES